MAMTQERLRYLKAKRRRIMIDSVSSGAEATIYSEPFRVDDESLWSLHLDWADDAADYAATVTLWASNYAMPEESDDSEWVQMDTGHGFSGLPGGDPSGGDGKDLVNVSAAAAEWYRVKIARTAGSGVVNARISAKSDR